MSSPALRSLGSPPRATGTVGAFATQLRKSAETLLEQLRAAGVEKHSSDDPLSDQDKQKLLGYLQSSHGTASPERKRITLVKGKPSSGTVSLNRNSVMLVGGLGRVDYDLTDAVGKKLLEAYAELVRSLYSDFQDGSFDEQYRAACRRMAETLKQLRKLVKRVLHPLKGLVHGSCRAGRHGGAFFHALKVDGRNLP